MNGIRRILTALASILLALAAGPAAFAAPPATRATACRPAGSGVLPR
jgi:hypothetical protein